jgi:hypothetical protein
MPELQEKSPDYDSYCMLAEAYMTLQEPEKAATAYEVRRQPFVAGYDANCLWHPTALGIVINAASSRDLLHLMCLCISSVTNLPLHLLNDTAVSHWPQAKSPSKLCTEPGCTRHFQHSKPT